MKIFFSLLILLTSFCSSSAIRSDKGLTLLQNCSALVFYIDKKPKTMSEDLKLRISSCSSYLKGVIDGHKLGLTYLESFKRKPNMDLICASRSDVSLYNMASVLIKYLNDHPEELKSSAQDVIFSAIGLSGVFDCH